MKHMASPLCVQFMNSMQRTQTNPRFQFNNFSKLIPWRYILKLQMKICYEEGLHGFVYHADDAYVFK
jgi:hypothetical protein